MFNLNSPKKSQQSNPPPQPTPEDAARMEYPPEVEASPVSSGASSATTNEPTHFDNLIAEAEAPQPAVLPSQMIGRDDFHKMFVFGFTAGHEITNLQSLKVAPENEAAKNCAYALYDTILDVPALHFMLMPQGKWFERIFAIGMFTLPMAQGIRSELQQGRNPRQPAGNFSMAKAATAKPSDGEPDYTQRTALVGA